MATFVTHARSLRELREEFLSDLNRRLAVLDGQIRIAKGASIASRLGARQQELQDVIDFWSKIELAGERRKSDERQKGPK